MFCPKCGAPNEDDAAFCGNCGATLAPAEATPEAGAEAERTEAGVEAAKEPMEEALPEPLAQEELPEPLAEALPEPLAEEALPAPLPSQPPPAYRPASYAPAAGLPTSGMAIASLILGIGGLTFVPLLGSIVAIILGAIARSDIKSRPSQVSGEGIAKAGVILGWIGVGLTVLGLVVFGAFTACGVCGALGSGNY